MTMPSWNPLIKIIKNNANKVFATREEAKKVIFEYIGLFYNRK